MLFDPKDRGILYDVQIHLTDDEIGFNLNLRDKNEILYFKADGVPVELVSLIRRRVGETVDANLAITSDMMLTEQFLGRIIQSKEKEAEEQTDVNS